MLLSAISLRKAFTLVELLVVISIIILLASLLIPAVMGSQESFDKMSTTNLVGSILVALNIQKLEEKGYPLPDEQESTTQGDPGYLIGVFRYDRSEVNPGIMNRLANSQKFVFDTKQFLGDDNILTDPWGTHIHYVLGDAKNSKNLKAAYDNAKPQDLNKPKDADVVPVDSDWNAGDLPGFPYIYSEGLEGNVETWIYTKE